MAVKNWEQRTNTEHLKESGGKFVCVLTLTDTCMSNHGTCAVYSVQVLVALHRRLDSALADGAVHEM